MMQWKKSFTQFGIILSVSSVTMVLCSFWLYCIYYQYNAKTIENHALFLQNQRLEDDIRKMKKCLPALQMMRPVQCVSAKIDYKLNTVTDLQLTYSKQEEKDNFIFMYKSISYLAKTMQEVLMVSKFLQYMINNCCIIYNLEIKKLRSESGNESNGINRDVNNRHAPDRSGFSLIVDFFTIYNKTMI